MPVALHSALVRHGFAAAGVAVAVAVRLALDPLLGDLVPFATLFFAVLVSAMFGGLEAGLTATFLGALASARYLLPPRDRFLVAGFENQIGFVLYLAVSLGISVLGGRAREARRIAETSLDEAIRQREELRTTLASIGDAVIVTDNDGRAVLLNGLAENLTGWTTSQAKGRLLKEVFVIVNEHTRQPVEGPVTRVLREGKVVGLANHTILIGRDGREHPIDDSAAPIWDPASKLLGVVLVFRDIRERREAEHALQTSEQQHRLLADSMPQIVFVSNAQGAVEHYNRRWFEYTGLDETNDKGWQDVVHPEDWKHVADQWASAQASGLAFQDELRIRNSSGEYRWHLARSVPLRDANGQVVRWYGASTDIHDLKTAQEELQRTKTLLAAVMDHSPACIFAKDREGRYLLANKKLGEMVGRDPAQMIGRTDADFFPPEVARQFAQADMEIIESNRPKVYEESFRHQGRDEYLLTAKFPLRGSDGKAYAACAVATVITELKQAREHLRTAGEQLSVALSAAELGDWNWSAADDFVTMSMRAAEIFGIPPGRCMTWTEMQRMILPGDREHAAEAVREAVAKRIQYDVEYRLRRHDGREVWISAIGRAHYLATGEPEGMFGVVQDVTDRKLAEIALREEAAANATLYRVGKTLAAEFDLEKILQAVTDESTAVSGAQFGAFFYKAVREGMEAYTLCTVSGMPREAFAGFPMPRNTAFFEPTFRGRQTVRLDDVTQDPRFGKNDPYFGMPQGHLPVRSYLAVPVTTRLGETVGGLFLGHSEVGVFTERHEHIVAGIASQATIATENAQLVAKVRTAESRLAAIVHHSPAIIFVKDLEGRYLLVNREYEALARATGIAGPYVGKTDAELLPKELADQFRANDLEVLQTKTAKTFEERALLGGRMRIGISTKFPLLNEQGAAYAICGINLDVTDRVLAIEAMRESEERLRLALEAGRMGVWDWNMRTNEIRWSDNLEAVHGLPPGGFDGAFESFQKLIHPDDRALVHAAIQDSIARKDSYDIEFRNLWPDGAVHWMAGKGRVFLEADQPIRMIGIGMDITQRKRNEQDTRFLADASASLAALVDFASTLQRLASLAVPSFADWCAVDMADDNGNLKRVAVAHIDPSKVELAQELHRKYPPDPESDNATWRILRTGKSEIVFDITDEMLTLSIKNSELLRITRELGLRSYMGVPLAVRGKVLGVITFVAAESGRRYQNSDLLVAEDLAHRAAVAIDNARLYQEVREADRRKDEFLAVLGHELRNPLAPISNALQILKRPNVHSGIVDQARQMMERQVQHMVRLVDDLLDVSRIVRGKVDLRCESIDLSAIVHRAVETSQPLIDAEGHSLTLELSSQPIPIYGDVVRLAQVVGNLLNNAARYSDRGGRITLRTALAGEQATVHIRDTGIGIAAEALPRIFDMFVQADRRIKAARGGMGIGLTLVKSLVELHGGSVEARSEGLGKGSEFVVCLPIRRAQRPVSTSNRSGASAAPGPVRRILVVDDNVDAAESLGMLLRIAGHETHVAHDGAMAIEVAKSVHPEIAFFDIGMPGMDGYELARYFRNDPSLREMKLIALTGWGQEEDRKRSKEAGFDAHEVKPVAPESLERILRKTES
ncbi:MAG: PAS domain-containing protein [Gemmataceae bacterium]|nr:PAS domain-containing protein [Gemmataceae bacterium]